ncbi:hypothetical protein EXIGLDRAFT_669928 [Exidia glandulosa HHB12029]|uniref:F-box domain-containing protein n=1 Tax=Exidia glandulosa HHB12029 TaxID=1314781 RepID=A0A166B490_EXIGL|nr:hypothetical protein EXIGLDRAFT_669928 [Exidia glandulosa HHB12029]
MSSPPSHGPLLHGATAINPLRPAARERIFGFDVSLYDELILLIFSWLDAQDLCAAQQVNKNWARLSQDQQLWKALYMRTHGRERLRGSRGLSSSAGDDERSSDAELESRSLRPRRRRTRNDKDWRWMFRVSSNWRSGRCAVDVVPLDAHLESESELPTSALLDAADPDQAHIILADGLAISGSSRPSLNPAVTISAQRDGVTATYHLYSSCATSDTTYSYVTALTVDQGRGQTTSPEDHILRIVVFYSNCAFAIFSIPVSDPSSYVEVATWQPHGPAPMSATSHAAYHHPLLVGLADDFTLSIYGVRDSEPSIERLQTLKSFTSFPPSSMVLSSLPRADKQMYKLVLSYAVPIYPSHWSLGVTDLTILRRDADCVVEHARSVKASSSRLPNTPAIPRASPSPLKRRISAPVVPVNVEEVAAAYSEADNAELQRAREQMTLEREQWARKVARVVATETDGRWVVLAGEQDGASLQVYRLSSRLVFVRNLFGHRSVVTALAVADGRCVSLGRGGEVWAWDLESGTGVEVDGPPECQNETFGDDGKPAPLPTITFDERRILCRSGNEVQIRRFDL